LPAGLLNNDITKHVLPQSHPSFAEIGGAFCGVQKRRLSEI
jgi:hypothetical protein